jgi:hypothetical protein
MCGASLRSTLVFVSASHMSMVLGQQNCGHTDGPVKAHTMSTSVSGCQTVRHFLQAMCACVLPAGHYELDLAQPVHAAIAARLRDESNDSPEGSTWINLIHDCAT